MSPDGYALTVILQAYPKPGFSRMFSSLPELSLGKREVTTPVIKSVMLPCFSLHSLIFGGSLLYSVLPYYFPSSQ